MKVWQFHRESVVTRLEYTPEALQDLTDIGDYISTELSSPQTAYKLVSEITNTIELLKTNPLMGASLSSIMDIVTDYRFLTIKKYLVFYRYADENIFIDRVIYSRRNYLSVLLEE